MRKEDEPKLRRVTPVLTDHSVRQRSAGVGVVESKFHIEWDAFMFTLELGEGLRIVGLTFFIFDEILAKLLSSNVVWT